MKRQKNKVARQIEDCARVIRALAKTRAARFGWETRRRNAAHAAVNKSMMENWEETGRLIEKYNVRMLPNLAVKRSGNKEWWCAGVTTLIYNKTTNHVDINHIGFGSTPHEAVRNAVKKFKNNKMKNIIPWH